MTLAIKAVIAVSGLFRVSAPTRNRKNYNKNNGLGGYCFECFACFGYINIRPAECACAQHRQLTIIN